MAVNAEAKQRKQEKESKKETNKTEINDRGRKQALKNLEARNGWREAAEVDAGGRREREEGQDKRRIGRTGRRRRRRVRWKAEETWNN